MNQAITLFWFRRDLRLHDNHGLWQALSRSKQVLPVFIFDPTILEQLSNKDDKRIAFIHQTLFEINEQCKAAGSSLLVLHDTPLNAFKSLAAQYPIAQVICNHDYEPQAIQRDEAIAEWLQSKNIPFHHFKDQVIFEKSDIVKADQKPYTIYTPYAKNWKNKLQAKDLQAFESEQLTHHFIQTPPFDFPSIESIGFNKIDFFCPSTSPADETIRGYEETRNFPALAGTSQLSIHLRFGTVSIRANVKKALALNEQWLNELIWREFFMMILFHFPQVVNHSFKPKYDHIVWRNNEREFELWCKGETGYPIVDAGMRELNATGFMHNRVRMIVASFLTKHLLIDWRWGEAYFAEKLLDYELSSNNGNWQWAAGCGCDAAPYFRIFNPSTQTKNFDPKLAYIKKWIPHYEPIYLTPIVEHTFARARVLAAYKSALQS